MNGVLFPISAAVQWTQAGMGYAFNATFSTAIGGYLKGSEVVLLDGINTVVSLNNGNTNNTTAGINGGTGWAPFGGALALAGNFGVDTGTANAHVVTIPLPIPSETDALNGLRVLFKAAATSTSSAVTLSVNASGSNLARSDGGALLPGDIVSGNIYEVFFDPIYFGWKLITRVPSQSISSAACSSVASVANSTTTEAMAGSNTTIVVPSSGKVIVQMMGVGGQSPGTVGGTAKLYWGTGSAPSSGDPVPGGAISFSSQTVSASANGSALLYQSELTGLTPGQIIWVDFSTASATGGSQFDAAASVSIWPQ